MRPSDSTHEIFQRLRMYLDLKVSPANAFQNLDPFPRLKRAHFAFCGVQDEYEVVTFLNAHGEGLEELRLSTVGVVSFSIAALQLPMLRKLCADRNFCHGWNGHLQPGTFDINLPLLDCLRITGTCHGDDVISFCDMFNDALSSLAKPRTRKPLTT